MPEYLVTTDGKHAPSIHGPYLTQGEAEQKRERFEGKGWLVYGPYHTELSGSVERTQEVRAKFREEAPVEDGARNFRHGG